MSITDNHILEPIEVILFDAAGTLFQVKEPVPEVYASFARDFGWDLEAHRVKDAFRSVWARMPGPNWEIQEGDPEKIWWESLVRRVLTAAGLPDPQREFPVYFESLWNHYARASAWELYPEVEEVLSRLQGEFRLGVLSNFDDRLFPVLDGLGIRELFDYVTISSHVRARKPAAAIFEKALQVHSVAPERALHVGDEPHADWSGARSAGIWWFELCRPEINLSALVEITLSGRKSGSLYRKMIDPEKNIR